MDIGHFYSSSTDLRGPRSRKQTNGKPKAKEKTTAKVKPSANPSETTGKAMVDNKSWRKKIGGKPKEVPPIKTGLDATPATPPTEVLSAVDAIDKRRHGWRKTIATTPKTLALRITMESSHSHMCMNYMAPVPPHYNSGLFQVFEDYRKLRAHREHLEARERSALDNSRKVTAQWHQSEILYEAEIRRLELLIARGTTGMDGLMEARRGTVVDRKRQHRKWISIDRVSLQYKYMSSVEIDDEIRSKTQQVLLHRLSSPSEMMAALSRQLTRVRVPDTSLVPPQLTTESVLSRKVKSELNLTDLRHTETSIATSGTTNPQLASTSGFELQAPSQAGELARDPLECEAFVALKELGVLVARRKGLDVSQFVDGLMTLLTCADSCQDTVGPRAHHSQEKEVTTADGSNHPAEDVMPKPPSRKPRSLSYPEHDHTRHRHFSFKPGDDQMRELVANLRSYDALSQPDSTDSGFSSSSAFRLFDDGLETDDDDTTRLLASASGELPKPTMIPSPVQTVGRVRRENSISSLQSVFVKHPR
ncbi:hypothetical protein E8E11_010106 [Didymella keratinophila]|nr:hypothetical protein E8E11_010106 [Didymella keratinophila]